LTITDLYAIMKLILMVMLSLLQGIRSNNIDNWYFRQKSMAAEVVFKKLGF